MEARVSGVVPDPTKETGAPTSPQVPTSPSRAPSDTAALLGVASRSGHQTEPALLPQRSRAAALWREGSRGAEKDALFPTGDGRSSPATAS